MSSAALGLAAALAAASWAAAAPDAHQAPAPNLADRPELAQSERQGTLSEMWQRRILSPQMRNWSPEDMVLLLRMRAAEEFGALNLLRRRFPREKGLTVLHKPARGPIKLRLTKEGFERWRFARAQDAIQYFESRGTDAGWAFRLIDLDGRELFGRDGLLSDAGEEVYRRAIAGQAVHWKTPRGEVFGNRPPPRPAAPVAAPAPEPAPPVRRPPPSARPEPPPTPPGKQVEKSNAEALP